MNMVSAAQKKTLHSMLAGKLNRLTIPPSTSASSSTQEQDFDFSEVFGSQPSPHYPNLLSSSPSSSIFLGDPQIIHNRSHSVVGPSPRFTLSKSLPFHHEIDSDSSGEDEIETENGRANEEIGEKEEGKGEKHKMGPGDFEIMRVIGKGAFGKVFQVRRDRNGDGEGEAEGEGIGDGIFAMKVMRKDTIIKNNHVDYMKAERDILTKVVHPFIVQLRYSFQEYNAMGFFSYGAVYKIQAVSDPGFYKWRPSLLPPVPTKNLQVMLTDFGLAKEIDESSRSNSMCGTTEYMAPEILLAKGHNKDADWWSVGILLYEMLTGKPPFTHANRKKLQEKIISEKVKLLPRLTSEVHSLLKGLLQKDPTKRLGSGPWGADEVKKHTWFRSINWKKLEARELPTKFKPDVNGEDCTANFDKCWTTMPLEDSPAPTPTAGEHFHGYTYVAPNPWLSPP